MTKFVYPKTEWNKYFLKIIKIFVIYRLYLPKVNFDKIWTIYLKHFGLENMQFGMCNLASSVNA